MHDSPPARDPLLRIERLSGGYGSADVLANVSIEVFPGEVVALLGPNGAGKTSLLWAISGLLPRRSGTIAFGGMEIIDAAPVRIAAMGIGHVPQNRHVFSQLSVEDNLRAGGHVIRDRAQLDTYIEDAYVTFPMLRQFADRQAGRLSGGQQQMLAIARALIAQPHLLVLDEPSSGLAPSLVAEVFAMIAKLAQKGLTMVVAEQSVEMTLRIAQRAYVMAHGEVVGEGSSIEVASHPHLKVAYLGRQHAPQDGSHS